jgi:hypothetical protein
MGKRRLSEEQVIGMVREAETGGQVHEHCRGVQRATGISER